LIQRFTQEVETIRSLSGGGGEQSHRESGPIYQGINEVHMMHLPASTTMDVRLEPNRRFLHAKALICG
jgi:hypothetical protein